MTTILVSVLAPVVLLAWWVLIVTTARDNVVIPEWARLMIRVRRYQASWTVVWEEALRAFASLVPVAAKASRVMQDWRGPLSKVVGELNEAGMLELRGDGGDECGE